MKCPKCSQEYDDSFAFCPHCAEPKPEEQHAVDQHPAQEPQSEQAVIQEQPLQPLTEQPVHAKQGFFQNLKDKVFTKTGIIAAALAVLVIVGLIVGLVLGLGGGDKESSRTGTSTKTTSNKTFTNENWQLVCSNPSGYEGAKVSGLVGKIFVAPEKAEGAVAIQMFADPTGSSQNTIVYYYGTNAQEFAQGDLIKVDGKVGDKFVGENAMGASLIVPTVTASNITKTDASALITGGKEVAVNQQQNQNGLIITVDKIVLRDGETDVFVRVSNQTGTKATFYDFNAKLQAGTQQYDLDSTKQYQYGSMSSDLLPGVEANGILVFPAIGSPVPATGAIALHLEGASDNYNLRFNPYVFNIAW